MRAVSADGTHFIYIAPRRNGRTYCGAGSVMAVREKCDEKPPGFSFDFAVIPMAALQKLMEDAEMLADVKAYDAAKARLADGSEELIPLEITERGLRGEPAPRVWRQHRGLTQERLAKKARASRALIAAIETKRKAGSVETWKRLGRRWMWGGSCWRRAVKPW